MSPRGNVLALLTALNGLSADERHDLCVVEAGELCGHGADGVRVCVELLDRLVVELAEAQGCTPQAVLQRLARLP